MSNNKKVYVLGGGAIEHITNHFAICTPAFGSTAKEIANLCQLQSKDLDVELILTKLADSNSHVVTNSDVSNICNQIKEDPTAKIVFFNCALSDFYPRRLYVESKSSTEDKKIENFGKYAERLNSDSFLDLQLSPTPKLIDTFRAGDTGRKDLFLVGFKSTCGATPQEQYLAGLNLLKRSSCNLVLANDTKTRLNMVICPEEAVYHETTDRQAALAGLVEMAYLRSHLTFTRSTVIAGDPVAWNSELIPEALRTIVDYCINRGAYKKFRGVTAGHFAVKLSDTEFLTSRRKTDFNDMKEVGLVKVKTDGPDNVIAYGSKPSVGGQSQRIVFTNNPDADCIVHFHCPTKPGSQVPVASQREFECGSHECGISTSNHLKKFGNISAVMLDQHGPNLVFHHSINPQEVIDFIEENFDLEGKTGGYMIE